MSFEQWILAAIGSAAFAAIGTWFSGLPLRRAAADPTIAERVQRHRVRLALVVIASAAATPFLLGALDVGVRVNPWFVPAFSGFLFAAGMGAVAGGYPLRRALFGERNPLPMYVWMILRGTLALYAYWITILLLPYLIDAAGWGAAIGLALVLPVWGARHPRYVCWMLGARPFEDPTLAPEFARVLNESTAPRPRVLVCGNDCGSVLNAFALPSLRDPCVLFTQPLLRDLEPPEVVGVFAHEVAHHEDFDAPTLRRWRLVECGLIFSGAAGAAMLPLFPAGLDAVFMWGWPLVVLFALIRRARTMQDRERYSDRRAAELGGDTEAYIRALEKIHSSDAIPRRIAGDSEQHASHPSLARRIQALRKPAGGPPPPPTQADLANESIYRARNDDSKLLVLEHSRVRWLNGELDDPIDEMAFAYDELMELRVVLKRGGAILRAVDTNGTTHEFLVARDDVARLQEDLERTDERLAPPLKAKQADGAYLLSFVCVFAATWAALDDAFGLGTDLLLMLTLLSMTRRRTRAAFAVLGAVGLVAALLQGEWTDSRLLVAGIAAIAVLGLAIRERTLRAGRPLRWAWLLIVLGVCGFLLVGMRSPALALTLHAIPGGTPLVYLLWVGAAAALLVAGTRAQRRWGALLAVVTLVALACGSDWFLREVVRDPLAVSAPDPVWREATYWKRAQTRVDGSLREPELSPGGRRFLLRRSIDRFVVGDFEGERICITATDVAFVDDDRLLRLDGFAGDLKLRLVHCDSPGFPLWRLELGDWGGREAELHVWGTRWVVLIARGGAGTARMRGQIGESHHDTDRWGWAMRHRGWRTPLPGGKLLNQYAAAGFDLQITALDRVEADGESNSLVRTGVPVHTGGSTGLALCLARRPEGAIAWTVDETLTARYRVGDARAWRWDGRRIALLEPSRVARVDLVAGTGVRAPLPYTVGWDAEIAFAGDKILILRDEGQLELIEIR